MPIYINTPEDEEEVSLPHASAICLICHNHIGKSSDNTIEIGMILPCGHTFGHVCLARAFASSMGLSATCPNCRAVISPTLQRQIRTMSPIIPSTITEAARGRLMDVGQTLNRIRNDLIPTGRETLQQTLSQRLEPIRSLHNVLTDAPTVAVSARPRGLELEGEALQRFDAVTFTLRAQAFREVSEAALDRNPERRAITLTDTLNRFRDASQRALEQFRRLNQEHQRQFRSFERTMEAFADPARRTAHVSAPPSPRTPDYSPPSQVGSSSESSPAQWWEPRRRDSQDLGPEEGDAASGIYRPRRQVPMQPVGAGQQQVDTPRPTSSASPSSPISTQHVVLDMDEDEDYEGA